jgi:DNA-binding HxlR family transcriptional regulator
MPSRLHRPALIRLGQYRWMLPVLAELERRGGGRFVELRHALGLPRDSLARTIDAAIAAGWAQRNPGHGHPLRPEVVLTAAGRDLAVPALALAKVLAEQGLSPAMLGRWSLPLIGALAEGRERFNDLARLLPEATPRALSLALQRLVANDLVGRNVEPGYPPSTHYRLTERGRALADAA